MSGKIQTKRLKIRYILINRRFQSALLVTKTVQLADCYGDQRKVKIQDNLNEDQKL